MKKFLILILALVSLSGCLGIGGEEALVIDLAAYSTNVFSINKPAEWQILEEGDFTSNISNQVLVAFRNNIRNESFTANVSITATKLNQGVTVSDFTNSQRAQLRATLIGYIESEITESSVPSVNINLPAELITFQGKRTANDPLIEFKQLSVVQNGVGYLVLASYLPNESISTLDFIDSMLSSFSLK